MTLKSLTADHVKRLAQFNEEYFLDGWTESMIISAFCTQRFFVIGAFIDEDMIGYISYTIGIDSADIESVVVKPTERKKGIAFSLIENVEKHIKELGISKILLEVRESNLPAISLYQKRDFRVISKRNKYYSDGENALVMIKELV